jgi:ribosome-binding factor A
MARDSARPLSQRQLRVGEEIRHALAWTLERGEVRDPGLAERAVTVTEVRVSPDLRQATAFVMPLGGADADAALAALGRARGYLRRRVAHEVTLRYVPELSFRLDPSFAAADHITALLNDPRVKRDLTRDDDHGPAGSDDGHRSAGAGDG